MLTMFLRHKTLLEIKRDIILTEQKIIERLLVKKIQNQLTIIEK